MKTIAVKEIERLVIAVDVCTWLLHPNSSRLASLIQQCVRKVLSHTSPSCRWAFKLFDSSLSPFPSRCKIGKLLGNWACSSRFDSVLPGGDSPAIPEVYMQFCSALNCLQSELLKDSGTPGTTVGNGKAAFVALSLLELLCDYVWDPLLPAQEDSAVLSNDHLRSPIQFNSNTVILFSSFPSTQKDLAHFLDAGPISTQADLLTRFCPIFKKARESFLSRNIHLCWIDVPLTISSMDHSQEIIRGRSSMGCFIGQLGWSSVCMDALLAGLHLIPFPILWHSLAHPLAQVFHKPALGFYKVCIQVKDVSNKLMNTVLCKVKSVSLGKASETLLKGKVLQITSFVPRKDILASKKLITEQALLHQECVESSHSGGKGRWKKADLLQPDKVDRDGADRHLLGDYVLRQLQQEAVAFDAGKPAWQLLMLYLARKESLAVVEICNRGSKFLALLEPLTVHLAVLSIIDRSVLIETMCSSLLDDQASCKYKKSVPASPLHHSRPQRDSRPVISARSVPCSATSSAQTENCGTKPSQKRKPLCSLDSSSHEESNAVSRLAAGNGRKRAKPVCPEKPDEVLLFAELKDSLALEELYLKSEKRSKVLKAMRCWIRQSKDGLSLKRNDKEKSASLSMEDLACSQTAAAEHSLSNTQREIKGTFITSICVVAGSDISYPSLLSPVLQDINESAGSLFPDSVHNLSFLETCPLADKKADASTKLTLEDAKMYIAALEDKISNCLASQEIDLYSFARRFVADTQRALCVLLMDEGQRQGPENCTEPTFHILLIDKLIQLLLKKPKKLSLKYRTCQPPTLDSQHVKGDANSSYSSEGKVREHELQILFRLEILSCSPEISGQKYMVSALVNEICKLLENIQFNLPGGVLEGESLFDFSNKVIKERYDERLPSIVEEIYTAMEFNGHDDSSEVEESEPAKVADDLDVAASDTHESLCSAEETFSQSENPHSSSSHGKSSKNKKSSSLQRALFKGVDTDTHYQELQEADERREHAKRFSQYRDSAERKLREAAERRERAKRFSHFASSTKDLLKVTVVPKVGVSIKVHSKGHTGRSRDKAKKDSDKEIILQTPLLSRKSQTAKLLLL